MEFTQQLLKDGKCFHFDNEQHCIDNNEDDFRGAHIWFNQEGPSWSHGFKIMFNGKLIHSSKTFKSLQKRFDLLKNRWFLQFTKMNTNHFDADDND